MYTIVALDKKFAEFVLLSTLAQIQIVFSQHIFMVHHKEFTLKFLYRKTGKLFEICIHENKLITIYFLYAFFFTLK